MEITIIKTFGNREEQIKWLESAIILLNPIEWKVNFENEIYTLKLKFNNSE